MLYFEWLSGIKPNLEQYWMIDRDTRQAPGYVLNKMYNKLLVTN